MEIMSDTNKTQSRAPIRKSSREIDVNYFIDRVLDLSQSIPHRTASAMNYCAEANPKELIPYPILYQMVYGLRKRPPNNQKEVVLFRKRINGAMKILHEKFGRGRYSVPGVGVRATVDSADRLTTEIPRKRSVAVAANRSLAQSMSAIDIRTVPSTPEFKEHKDWFVKNSKHILDESNDLIKRLLPSGDK